MQIKINNWFLNSSEFIDFEDLYNQIKRYEKVYVDLAGAAYGEMTSSPARLTDPLFMASIDDYYVLRDADLINMKFDEETLIFNISVSS